MIRMGVVGYGYWGPNLARCVAEAEDCTLAAVADSSPAALKRAGLRHPGARLHADWGDLIADTDVDAVLIATPVSTHFRLALAALQAGKHVLVEKPMTETSAQAETLIEEAARRRLTLMVDHSFVYTGAVRKIQELLSNGELGELFYYDSTRINLGLFRCDVNVIWDLAVHDLAILEHLIEAPALAVTASGAGHIRGSQESMAHVTLFYPGGVTAHLNVSWLAPVKVRQTLIGGSRRMIVYNDLEPSEKVKVYDRGVSFAAVDGRDAGSVDNDLRVNYRMGDMWAPQLPLREALLTEVEHFADCITRGDMPMTPGESGLRVVGMLEAVTTSLRRRGQPVELGAARLVS